MPGIVAGDGTATPRLVTGLAEKAAGGSAEAAARRHLAAHPDRYHVATAPADLAAVRTEGRTVRFQQRHHGIPVLGAQYLVHFAGSGDERRVTGTGGAFYTGLAAPTTATVPAAASRGMALATLTDPRTRADASVTEHGLVVLPGGTGRLTRHYTLRAVEAASGEPVLREVYVDATVGGVALTYDSAQRGEAPATAGRAEARSAQRGESPATAGRAEVRSGQRGEAPSASGRTEARSGQRGESPATATGTDVHGKPATFDAAKQDDGSYRMTDLTRGARIDTYDADGRDYGDFLGEMPAGLTPVTSPAPAFPEAAGTSGAVNAHINAAKVHDFYKSRFGRDGLDGKGGTITSVVNVTSRGRPYANAFWDGTKMVYGGGGTYLPFSASLDVAGHEMTHGVITHTANLLYLNQSGALNEALADYFGNAIEVESKGLAMSDPRAGLLGEDLCRTGTPEKCAIRDLNDGRSTTKDYLGVTVDNDNGGVHLNSTIFSGALWDVREKLSPRTADQVVYTALSEYLTPLDDFVDGRNAVLAAAEANGLSRAELRTIARAFDAHGIREGWQRHIGIDSRTVLPNITDTMGAPSAAHGRWVMSNSDATGNTLPAVYTGRTDGKGKVRRLSPDDGRWHAWAATDGKRAVWMAYGAVAGGEWGMEVLTRELAGGPIRSVFRTATGQPGELRISGDDIAFQLLDYATGQATVRLSRAGAPATAVPLPDGHQAWGVTLRNGKLAWSEYWRAEKGTLFVPTVYDIARGKVTAQHLPQDTTGATSPLAAYTVLAGGELLWIERGRAATDRSAIRAGALDSTRVRDVLPATSPQAPRSTLVTASDQAVTYVEVPEGTGMSNANLTKLHQLPLKGGQPARLSCDRGTQIRATADTGRAVLWLDGTGGQTDLVTRSGPVRGGCR
ncbi:M4 family metallopeptidase [Streptomyces sp. NPDC003077]|uniref:M4 family metallopeptidase n=1 Tax=Streptomyces sp. NPDC003077 TaxID=3154443 RepID=UPI0033B1615F